ncbi:MAG: AarF/ABC1/UbiB kinase family protein [Symploca sp. SIO1A3]|nr:AarF/ABC1/UbiB kinase family protein [Symploca sp. SIO1A3]
MNLRKAPSHHKINSEAPLQESASQSPTKPVEVEYELSPKEMAEELLTKPSALDQNILRYDPVEIEAKYRTKKLQVFGRLVNIVWPFASFSIGIWWDRLRGKTASQEQRRAIQLREILTRLGPAYIKVGQALSTRPDLVSQVYLEELALLQDQLPPFPNEVAFQFIEEELGAPPDDIYMELTSQPVAAASLGQVYKGKLKTGETVAVKVQRPGLAQRITLDVYILRSLAGWIKNRFKQIRSDLVAIMDEFGARIFEEMNYTKEGQNAERFAQLYGHLSDIYVPQIYWEYTGRRVITMEWISGTKLTKMEEIKAQGIDAKYLIEIGVQCSLRQLLEHGFFHADPHPGNLLATNDGKLAYIDFGMMSEVKPYQRYGLLEAIVHLVNRDFENLASDYVKLEFLTPDTDLTPIVPALKNVFKDALGASVAELNFKSITDKLSALMYEYPFQVPAYYALIIRSLVTLEGIAINVEPNFKVLSKAYPYVSKRLLTDPSPRLRASLKDLLFKDDSFRWNRLENLLRNAAKSPDYELNQLLNQTLEFLFSERGAFIRERLVDEIVKALDTYGRRTLSNLSNYLQETLGLAQKPTQAPEMTVETTQSAEHIKRIWEILQETPGFDPMQLVPVIPELLMKEETQRMGQKIAGGLAQRVIARMIREALIKDSTEEVAVPNEQKTTQEPKVVTPTPKLLLPPAALIQ